MMKKLIYAALPAVALLASGCNECKKAFQLKADTQTLETLVMGTITTPGSLPQSCKAFSATYDKKLSKGASFSDRAARELFYSEDRRCRVGHYERRCGYDRYPGGRYPYPGNPGYPYDPGRGNWDCHDVYVCDYVEVIPHKKDGYDQARELASLLRATRVNLKDACTEHSRGDDMKAIVELAKAKMHLSPVQNDSEYVLRRAGCYDRQGD